MSFFGVELNAQINRLMFEIRIHLSRNKFMPNFRTIYRSFVEFDPEISGTISSIYFEKALNANGIFFKKYEWQVFEKGYQKEKGQINWFDFISHLREPMGPQRRLLVEEIFEHLDEKKQGQISIETLLAHFNPSEIQSFRLGRKSRQIIEKELFSLFSIQDGCITREQFIAFYDDMNINFPQNDVFYRFVSTFWHYTPLKMAQAKEEQVKAGTKALRYKLLEKSQATKDEYLLKKLFSDFDCNKNGCLSAYDLDWMLKKLQIKVEAHVVAPILQKLDRNKSGYLEYEDFKEFIARDPYPI